MGFQKHLLCDDLALRELYSGRVDVDGCFGGWCWDVEDRGDRDPEGSFSLGSLQQDSEGVRVGSLCEIGFTLLPLVLHCYLVSRLPHLVHVQDQDSSDGSCRVVPRGHVLQKVVICCRDDL